jgi:hypothetical protein
MFIQLPSKNEEALSEGLNQNYLASRYGRNANYAG